MIYKSQNGQCRYILENLFRNPDGSIKNDGYFVDIGAHDGVESSATYAFEKTGWKGMCIEPLPAQYEKLRQSRSATCVNATVSDLNKPIVDFLEVTGKGCIEMLSGISEKLTTGHVGRIDWANEKPEYAGTKKTIQIPNYRFNDLVTETHINFLSIDTEGCDLEILNSIDYNKYKIDVICFEENGCAYEHKRSTVNTNADFVEKYTLIGRIVQDFILVEKNYLSKVGNLPSLGLTNLYI
jgi:FkbM family methyltransferase